VAGACHLRVRLVAERSAAPAELQSTPVLQAAFAIYGKKEVGAFASLLV